MIHVSALPLLACKVGPNLFDLSSGLYNVSLRDQQHRAVALAEALVDGRQLQPDDQVLIVGAGLAGVAAGTVLARHGVVVQLVDASPDAPFALQRGVHERYVGPYLYEWPLAVHDDQRLPPQRHSPLAPWDTGLWPPLGFAAPDPAQPDDLVRDWDAELGQAMANAGGRLRLQVGIDRARSNQSVKDWLVDQRQALAVGAVHAPTAVAIHGGQPWGPGSHGPHAPHAPLVPRFVLLAAGMGDEVTRAQGPGGGPALQAPPFWRDDDLRTPRCGQPSAPRVVVLGGGDGALQDALRAATGEPHPLRSWDRLRTQDPHGLLAPALARILALEVQHAQTAVWARADALKGAPGVLDGAHAAVAHDLAQDPALAAAALDLLRDVTDVQSVCVCLREAHFGKAYALNRFMVHLLDQSQRRWGRRAGQTSFEVVAQWALDRTQALGGTAVRLHFLNGQSLDADRVVVRFGADTSALPGQWLGLTRTDTVNRQELAAVPLPLYLPPTR